MEETQNMELKLLNPKDGDFLKHIEWNGEEIKNRVQEIMQNYTNVVYTDDMMGQAKEDRAALNKLSKALDDKRKEVKKILLEPYNTFESEVKEVLQIIEQPKSMIDSQIKAYDEKKAQEKKEEIRKAYDDCIGDLSQIVSFDDVFDQRYLNVTYKLKDAISDVQGKVERIRTDLQTIESIDSKYKLNAKDVYLKCWDLSRALAENKRLMDLEAELEKRKQEKIAEEERRIAKEREQREAELKEKEAVQKESVNQEETGTCDEEIGADASKGQGSAQISQNEPINHEAENTTPEVKESAPAPTAKRYKAKFYAIGTIDQLQELKNFMKARNIEFGKVGQNE